MWLAEVLGGGIYTARLGGHHALLRSHLGIGIRDEHRRRWLELMAEVIDEVLPGRPELAAALMSYFEWGTAIAQDVSQEPVGSDVGEPGPTPRWGLPGARHRPGPAGGALPAAAARQWLWLPAPLAGLAGERGYDRAPRRPWARGTVARGGVPLSKRRAPS